MSVSFTAIDFETANRSPASACAVGVVRVLDGEVVDSHYSLLRPPLGHNHFEAGNIRVHGIRPADVLDAPAYEQYWPWLEDIILRDDPHAVLVAHNAVFDMGVIRAANRACGLPAREWDYACTLGLSRAAYDLPSYALPSVARFVQADLQRHHDALCDAQACADIAMDLARRSQAEDMLSLARHYGVGITRRVL